ncbi:MAG: hypothetical protein LBI13_02910 [Streptococcaceae bacterium]|jgi:hypothetical protein|nr:hypothetical protein [Streptococcaceae bacterium]
MIRKNRINKINQIKFETKLGKLSRKSHDFISIVDLKNVTNDESFINEVAKSLGAPKEHSI